MGLGLDAIGSELALIHGPKQHVWSEWLQLDSEGGCLALLSRKWHEVWKAAPRNAPCTSSLLFSELGPSPPQRLCLSEQVKGAYPSQTVSVLLAHQSSKRLWT